MTETVTPDGYLARHVEGNYLALAFDLRQISDHAVDELTHPRLSNGVKRSEDWEVIGRSSLGVALGIDISPVNLPAVVVDGSLQVPIDVEAHAESGQRLLPRLYELRDEHKEGEELRWNGYRLAFGRLLHIGGLEQLTTDDLSEAVEQNLLGFGQHLPNEEPDVEIEDNAITLPLAPWELKPNMDILKVPANLFPMLQEGRSGRAFALDNMKVETRGPKHTLGNFVVSSVLLSPGPYFCEVVEAVSPAGRLPQVASAAWLDANRSRGLHPDEPLSHRGRQVEVVNRNPNAVHPWTQTRVNIKAFCPRPSQDDSSAYSTVEAWMKLSPRRRQELHRFGYRGAVQV